LYWRSFAAGVSTKKVENRTKVWSMWIFLGMTLAVECETGKKSRHDL
jgi:hypothetical protein